MAKNDSDDKVAEFVRLLGQHEHRTFAFILSLVPNWNDAEEIAQEVRVKLWEQFEDYDPSKDFGTWARTIAYYQVLAYRKTCTRRHARFSRVFLDTVADRVEETSDQVEARRRALASCLEKLSQSSRDLLRRYYAGEQARQQIAEELGRSFDALRKSVQRIRNSLAACIEKWIQKEEHA